MNKQVFLRWIFTLSLMELMTEHKIIAAETTGEIHIKISSQYNNLNATVVIVEEKITARLFGTISDLLIIKKGAIVYLHGAIKGKIENRGGKLHTH